MNKTLKKIRLHRETLRLFKDYQLSGAQGGGPPSVGCPPTITCGNTCSHEIACFNTT